MSHPQELGPPILCFISAHILAIQISIKQVVAVMLEKTSQGALVRERPSKALAAGCSQHRRSNRTEQI